MIMKILLQMMIMMIMVMMMVMMIVLKRCLRPLDNSKGSDGRHWAKGTGYSTTDDDRNPDQWSHDDYLQNQLKQAKKIETLVKGITCFLVLDPSGMDCVPDGV